jgi:hypothetical protein
MEITTNIETVRVSDFKMESVSYPFTYENNKLLEGLRQKSDLEKKEFPNLNIKSKDETYQEHISVIDGALSVYIWDE